MSLIWMVSSQTSLRSREARNILQPSPLAILQNRAFTMASKQVIGEGPYAAFVIRSYITFHDFFRHFSGRVGSLNQCEKHRKQYDGFHYFVLALGGSKVCKSQNYIKCKIERHIYRPMPTLIQNKFLTRLPLANSCTSENYSASIVKQEIFLSSRHDFTFFTKKCFILLLFSDACRRIQR